MDIDDKLLKANMNQILLNINEKSINLPILNKNIDDIYVSLYLLDPEKEPHKYLCLSCIFGAFLGDSIGSCCEFSSESPENHLDIFRIQGIFNPGEVTDDSEMAMSAAFAYIDILNEKPEIIQNLIYYYFGVWRGSGPKDIGGATTNALRFWNENQSILETEFKNKFVRLTNWDSLANGFLMRISTFIVYYYYTHLQTIYDTIQNFFNNDKPEDDLPDTIINLYLDIYKESYKNVEITHPNYENGISSAVFTLMTFVGMVTKDAKRVYSIFYRISKSQKFIECHKDKALKFYADLVKDKYSKIISDVNNNIPFSVVGQMGYYMHGFKLCIYFLHKYPDMAENKDKDLYYDIMCEVCDKGGDTDTNCAIVGAMLGPLIGFKNFKSDIFETFIKFVPYNRCQFTSASMYVYVNYLEKKLLNNPNTKKVEIKSDLKNEEQKKIKGENPELLGVEGKKEDQNEEKKTAEIQEEGIKNNIKDEKKIENNEENKGETKETTIPSETGVTTEGVNKGENKNLKEKEKEHNNIEKPKSENKEEGFKYTAYKLILQFLNEKMEL